MSNFFIFLFLFFSFGSVQAMDPLSDGAMDIENNNDVHFLYRAAVFLGDITNNIHHQRPVNHEPEAKRRRIQCDYPPAAAPKQYCPPPYTDTLYHPIPLRQKNHALLTQDQDRLPTNHGAAQQSLPPRPSQEQYGKWKYVLDKKGTLGKISFNETNPGKIPLFTTESTKDYPSKHAKEFKELKFLKARDINRKLLGLRDLLDALSQKIKFGNTMDRRVNFQFGDLNYYIELELDPRIYDLIINEDIQKKIAVMYYRIWNYSRDCSNNSRLTAVRLFERQFVKYLLNNQNLMFSPEGREELLLSIGSASLASTENSAIKLVKSHFIIEDSGDTSWDRLHNPIWSLALTDKRFDPQDSALSLLISVENFNRAYDRELQKLLVLRSEEFGLNHDIAHYLIYLVLVISEF